MLPSGFRSILSVQTRFLFKQVCDYLFSRRDGAQSSPLKAGYHRHWLSMVNSGLALHHFTELYRVSPSLQVSSLGIQSKRGIALLRNLKLQCPFVFQS